MLTVAWLAWPLKKTYTRTLQTAGSWARILNTCYLKRNIILFICHVRRVESNFLVLHTWQRDKIVLRLLVWRTNSERERERTSYVICNNIKNMSIKHFFIHSDVLTEQHRLQTRIRTGKCNLFNLIPKLLSPNIGYDSNVRYQTKQMHLPHLAGRFAGRRSSLQSCLPFISLSFHTALA